MTDLTQDDLARSVAAELGGDVVTETEKSLRGETSRAFGITEAMAIAGFIAQCAQLGLMIWQSSPDRVALAARLEAEAPPSPKVDDAKRRGIIARIVEKLTGGGQ